MKRYSNLYSQIIEFDNLFLAARKAQSGKRFRDNVLDFNFNLEKELMQLQRELKDKNYHPGAYRTFHIIDPKSRLISAAPYRDRVVHHALCNIIAPIFERTFIHDSYANRVGFGTHKALKRFIGFTRSSSYILQCDIKKYFPSLDHEILKGLIRRKIKCPDTLWLIDTIIDNSNEQETVIDYFPSDDLLTPIERKRGLPIGNLTSQFFANIYLNVLDHFIKKVIKTPKYVRYVDDFALFADERDFLVEARGKIEEYLIKLRLKIHPISRSERVATKSQLFATKYGASFLGFRILPDRVLVRNSNLHRGRRRLRRLQQDYAIGTIEWQDVERSLTSWMAHLEHGDTWQLRKQIFSSLTFVRH